MKQITLIITMMFMLGSAASLYATTLKCTVEKVEGNIITMDCGEKAANIAVGTKVKVKTQKAKAAIEGC